MYPTAQQVVLPHHVKDPGGKDICAEQVALSDLVKDPGGMNFAAKQVVLQYLVKDPGGMDMVAEQVVLPYFVNDPGGMDYATEQFFFFLRRPFTSAVAWPPCRRGAHAAVAGARRARRQAQGTTG